MHLDRLFRVGDVQPAPICLPSFGDNLNQCSPHRRVGNVREAIAAGLYIHFQFLVLLQRMLLNKFHVHAGVLNGNALLAAGHFNGDSRLHVACGRRSLRLGCRCQCILGRQPWGSHRTGREANTCKKLRRESHKSLNSIVYGTAGWVKSLCTKIRMPRPPEMLPPRCSAVETPCNGHLTHLFSSCKFSRNCSAAKMGTLQK